jgi:flavodoxin
MNPRGVSRRKLLGLITAGSAAAAGLLAVNWQNASGPGWPGISPVNAGGTPPRRGDKTLVVFYSKTGRNFPDLNLEVGNTAQVAGFIHDRVGGDRYEVVPAEPYPMQTFMRDHDLNGARIVPFVTHEGSQFGNSLEILGRYYPQADVLDGYARQGQQVYRDPDGTRTQVNSWLEGLGF